MSAETELFSVLDASAGLAALVGDAIFPDAIPENKDLPAVVFMRASTNHTHTIGGVLVCEDVRFAITAWAVSRIQAEAIADAVSAALRAAGNPPVDRSSGFDNETGLFAVTVDVDWFVSY
jgi:hypothetical protein